MEVSSPAGLGVGDVHFPRTRLLCDGCPPLGCDGWVVILRFIHEPLARAIWVIIPHVKTINFDYYYDYYYY